MKKIAQIIAILNSVSVLVLPLTCCSNKMTEIPPNTDGSGNDNTDGGGNTDKETTPTEDKKYKSVVSLDANGGTCQTSSLTFTYGKSYELPIPTYAGKINDDIEYEKDFLNWIYNGEAIPIKGDSWPYKNEVLTLTATYNMIEYSGAYPQTKVEDSSLVSTLTSLVGSLPSASNSQKWVSYGFFVHYPEYIDGSWDYEGGITDADYMWYRDIVYDNEVYRGVYFTSYRPSLPLSDGEKPTEKTSYQDENGYVVDSLYFFKWEDVAYRECTLSNGTKMRIASKAIDAMEMRANSSIPGFAGSYKGYDSTSNKTAQVNNYEVSHVRGFLNTEFYKMAFTHEERDNIPLSTIDNSKATTYNCFSSEVVDDTKDHVFLLSYQDLKNNDCFPKNENTKYPDTISQELMYTATDYAKCMGLYIQEGTGKVCFWWTRSPKAYTGITAGNYYGGITEQCFYANTCAGVVPAWIVSK